MMKVLKMVNSTNGYEDTQKMVLNWTEEDFNTFINNIQNFSAPKGDGSCLENADHYCDGTMKSIATAYKSIHGYVSLAVCIFGTIANVINAAVLTRREMCGAPINRILTGLAVADMLVMLEYVPFSCYMYLIFPDTRNFPYSWAVFILFHMHFSQILHTISICHTLTLAIWRYIAIRHPQQSLIWCTEKRCNIAIFASYVLPLFVCIPSYLVFHIRETTIKENSTKIVLYHLGVSDIAKERNRFLYNINFWIYGVVMKLLPCAILTVISCCLIRVLYKVNTRKQALKGYNSCNTTQLNPAEKRLNKVEKKTDRTTRMLVAILLLFLITEFPQGILGLLSGILGTCFFRHCYVIFGELMDILALINGAINFILYCFMSRQFRLTFEKLFASKGLKKWSPKGTQTDIQTTGMVTIVKPFSGEGRIVYEVTPVVPSFADVRPPVKQGHGKPYEVGNRDFFLDYRKNVLSKYTPCMYKWGENYSPYVPRPKIAYSHRKQRWEEMFSKPQIQLTFKDSIRTGEIDNFYMLCQFQRQYYNDYTGTAHPMDYFKKDVDKWSCPPDLNSVYVQCPVTYVKYKQPLTLPLTKRSTWSEPLEPSRRLAGKRDPGPDLKFPR